ncbi:precursor of CEP14-like [Trifolium pratense]|uniref:precursor of CEP14-like n=1 Tax=Trifolium pratense TaxID=57577 RepID=UPI001E696BCA|nr:precursor of CEP14-like [Trifolium pratense]
MGHISTTQLVLLLILFSSLCSSLEARKLHLGSSKHKKIHPPPTPRDSLFLSSLPKGKIPYSAPSKRGNSIEVDEKLVARHLISTDESEVRILLRSVPSPGAGH